MIARWLRLSKWRMVTSQLRQKYRVLHSRFETCKWWQHFTSRMFIIQGQFLRKNWESQWSSLVSNVRHLLTLSSDARNPVAGWAGFMANYKRETPYDWEKIRWNNQSSTQCRIIRIMISGTVFPYSDLQVKAEFNLQGAQYLQPLFYRKKQGDRWKRHNQTPSFAGLLILLISVKHV